VRKVVELEERVQLAKTDPQILNDLITDYRPFIQNVVHETCKRYVEWGHDEELSIGLIAFEEAVKRFEATKGHPLSFARTLIRNRVIDHLRKENKHYYTDLDSVPESVVAVTPSVPSITEEISELQVFLKKYDISFDDLPNVSPVKKALREELKHAAKELAKNSNLIKQLLEKKQLPVRAIADKAAVSHKKIERNRVYVITIALIWHLDLPLLQGYLK